MEEARIDKWLWAARIFKTRTLAADACKNGRVTIEGVNVKPSRMVKVGETVSVRKPPITYSDIRERYCSRAVRTSGNDPH